MVPARGTRRYKSFYALVIAPQQFGETTKTGQTDDSVVLGDNDQYAWIGELMPLLIKDKQADDLLFPHTRLSDYEAWMRAACKQRGYAISFVTPHVLRHSGPSNNKYHKRSDLIHIQKRGRWQSKKSVMRYEKEAVLLGAWATVTEMQQRAICDRARSLPSKLLAAWKTATRA